MSKKYQSVENSVRELQINDGDGDFISAGTYTWWEIVRAKFESLGYTINVPSSQTGEFIVSYDEDEKIVRVESNPPCTDHDIHLESRKSEYYNPHGPFFKLKPQPKTFKIGSHEVKIKDNRVYVGCQNFDIKELKRQASVVNQVRNSVDELVLNLEKYDEDEECMVENEVYFDFTENTVCAGGETHDISVFDMLVKYVED